MLGAPCSPCCGCSRQAASEIHQRLWSASVSLTLNPEGYQGQQGATIGSTIYSAASIYGIESPDRTAEADAIARAGLASGFSFLVWEEEPSLGASVSLSADLSKYAVEPDGFIPGAWFTYDGGALTGDIFIGAYETAPADDPHVYPGTPCRLRVFGNIVMKRRFASVTEDSFDEIGGVASVPQYDTWQQNPFTFGRSTVLAHLSPPTYFAMRTFELPGNVFAAPQGFQATSTSLSEAAPAWPYNAIPSVVDWSQSPPVAVSDGSVGSESSVGIAFTNSDFDAATFSPTGGTLQYPRRTVQAPQASRFRDYDIPTGTVHGSGGMFTFNSITPQGLATISPRPHRFSISGSATSTRTYGASGNDSFHVTPEISIVW